MNHNNNDCKHPALFRTLCVACGKQINHESAISPVSNSSNSYKSSLNISGGEVLQLSKDEVISIQTSKRSSLHSIKKLALVLDLDHTLVHAVQVEGQIPPPSRSIENMGTNNEIYHLPIEEMVNGTIKHLVMKKRPFLDKFLEECHSFCQMTIYTAGTRRYAEAVTKIIDPMKKYFVDRIVSRSDVSNIRADGNDKSLERIYPGDSSMAVIIDDREDVWRGIQGEQLILVKPFVHFDPIAAANASGPASLSMNSAFIPTNALNTISRTHHSHNNSAIPLSPAISLCSNSTGPSGRIIKLVPQFSVEASSLDDQLYRCYEILQQIHATYYNIHSIHNINQKLVSNIDTNTSSSYNVSNDVNNSNSSNNVITTNMNPISSDNKQQHQQQSVARILNTMKQRILYGCTLTFSGIIPTNEGKPEHHLLWRLAESLGAQVSLQVLPRTTHLISLHLQTQKVNECLHPNRNSKDNVASEVWILHPDWLIYCRWGLAKAQESTFMLNALTPGQSYPKPTMNYTPLTQEEKNGSHSNTTTTNMILNVNKANDNNKRTRETVSSNNSNNNNGSISALDSVNDMNIALKRLKSTSNPSYNPSYNPSTNPSIGKLSLMDPRKNRDSNSTSIPLIDLTVDTSLSHPPRQRDRHRVEVIEKESPLSALLKQVVREENNNNYNDHDNNNDDDISNQMMDKENEYIDTEQQQQQHSHSDNNSNIIEDNLEYTIDDDDNEDQYNEYNDDENLNMKGWNDNDSTDDSEVNLIEEGEIINDHITSTSTRKLLMNMNSNRKNNNHCSTGMLFQRSNSNHSIEGNIDDIEYNNTTYSSDDDNNNNDEDDDDFSDFEAVVLHRTTSANGINTNVNGNTMHTSNSVDTLHSSKYYSDDTESSVSH